MASHYNKFRTLSMAYRVRGLDPATLFCLQLHWPCNSLPNTKFVPAKGWMTGSVLSFKSQIDFLEKPFLNTLWYSPCLPPVTLYHIVLSY